MKGKFTDKDRKLVLERIEEIQKTKLEAIKPSRKLFKDTNGMFYLISGGTEDWHEINSNLVKVLKSNQKEGVFIVAKKFKSRIEIYAGSLLFFITNLSKLYSTNKGDYQFHCERVDDGIVLQEIPDFHCNDWETIKLEGYKRDLSKLNEISKIINIEIPKNTPITHSDLQAKLLLIGSYLNYRTYVAFPDKGKVSTFGKLGDLCSEKEIPEGAIPALSVDTMKYVDVIWFDEEGYPTHAFEVEHTTDITKGLLRLYQVHKLRIKMYVVAEESEKKKFEKEVSKDPFRKIQKEFLFKNYEDLDEFFQSVKHFSKIQESFLTKK